MKIMIYFGKGKHGYSLALLTPSPHILVETETLVYPFSSLVAQFEVS